MEKRTDFPNLNEYDGIYFLPNEEESAGMRFLFFTVEDEYKGEPIEKNEIGDKWHIVFFDAQDNKLVFQETFEAIFGDPVKYLKNLLTSGLYGCMIRKTENSHKWIREYLENFA